MEAVKYKEALAHPMGRKSQSERYKAYVRNYKERYRDYTYSIDWPYEEKIDEENEAVDVWLEMRDGQRLSANFITRKCLDSLFKKNEQTGECASGAYFCMPGMVIVNRLNEDTIRATIDDLIVGLTVEEYFKKYD